MEDYTSRIYTLKDIQNFIATKAEETTYLEFKAAGGLSTMPSVKDEITRDVSSFANSDGGLIIYGLMEANHIADSLDFVDGKVYTKEWLEQIIGRIQRKIQGVAIYPIRVNNNFKKSIYVVEIPRSVDAPHRAADGKFYRRSNFVRTIMEEYEIRDMYSRTIKTELEILEPKVNSRGESYSQGTLDKYQVSMDIEIQNIGKAIEKMYKVEVIVPTHLVNTTGLIYTTPFFSKFSRTEGDYGIYTFPHQSELYQSEIFAVPSANFFMTQQTFNLLQTLPIIIKLYFSGGQREKNLYLTENLKHKPKSGGIEHDLKEECFMKE